MTGVAGMNVKSAVMYLVIAALAGSLASAGLLLSGCGSGDSSATSNLPPDESTLSSPLPLPTAASIEEATAKIIQMYKDRPELVDMAVYAWSMNITIEQAMDRQTIRDSFNSVHPALMGNEADTFCGMWIQHEPEYKFVIAFTRDGETTIKKYVSAYQMHFIELRTFRYTLNELLAGQRKVGDALNDLGIRFISGVRIQENAVVIEITDRSPVDQAVAEGKVVLPDFVRIEVVSGLAEPL
jgi:hypothetical protein